MGSVIKTALIFNRKKCHVCIYFFYQLASKTSLLQMLTVLVMIRSLLVCLIVGDWCCGWSPQRQWIRNNDQAKKILKSISWWWSTWCEITFWASIGSCNSSCLLVLWSQFLINKEFESHSSFYVVFKYHRRIIFLDEFERLNQIFW